MAGHNVKVAEINNKSINLKRGLVSGVTGFVITISVFILASLLIYMSILPEGAVKSIVIVTTSVAGFISGYYASKNAPMYGLINGIISGFIYFIILYISNMLILAEFSFNTNILFILLLILVSSALGGIIGINVRASRKSRKR